MKKRALLTLVLSLAAAFFLDWSCSTNTPTSANNFQNPVGTVVGINPTFTPTSTFTFSPTQTTTPTVTPTPTFTPYAVGTWSGFNDPSALAVDGNGNVFVGDLGNNTISKLDRNGNLVMGWGVKGKIPYATPQGIAVDGSGNLYAVGNGSGVTKYGTNGFGATSYSPTSFSNPKGVAVDGSGNIFVSDSGNNRIVQMNPTGSLNGFGGSGLLGLAPSTTIPSSNAPSIAAVTINGAVTLAGIAAQGGNVLVATQGTGINGSSYSMVLGFDIASGNVTVPILGFNGPGGLAFDNGGNLWVAETGGKSVEEFGAGTGLFQLPLAVFNDGGASWTPTVIAVDGTYGNIYVVDSSTHSIVHFKP